MNRIEGPQTPYEVYCSRCRVTFPVEARRCLHCGGRLGGRDERPSADTPIAPEPAAQAPDGEEAEEGPVMMVRRFGGIAIWTIVALAAVLQNLCHRGID